MVLAIKDIIEGALKPISDIIDELHTSREEKDAAKIQLAIAQGTLDAGFTNAQKDIIISEATGHSWLQQSWRPITMLTFVFIIAWNYVIGPIGTWGAGIFGGPAFPVLDLPTGLWATINVGLGGYITARTVEKIKLGKEKK
jgi:hypothetical protein